MHETTEGFSMFPPQSSYLKSESPPSNRTYVTYNDVILEKKHQPDYSSMNSHYKCGLKLNEGSNGFLFERNIINPSLDSCLSDLHDLLMKDTPYLKASNIPVLELINAHEDVIMKKMIDSKIFKNHPTLKIVDQNMHDKGYSSLIFPNNLFSEYESPKDRIMLSRFFAHQVNEISNNSENPEDYLRRYFHENSNDDYQAYNDTMKSKLMLMYSNISDKVIQDQEDKLNTLKKIMSNKISKRCQ